MDTGKKYFDLIHAAAITNGIGAEIIYGVCMAESAMNQFAVRYEPHFKWLWKPRESKPPGCSMDTEVCLQRTSLGLMQMMGAVFRELGYRGWLTEVLSRPDVQIQMGAYFLARKIKKYGLANGIAAYNSGSPRFDKKDGSLINQYYVERVLGFGEKFLKSPHVADGERL